MNLLSLIIALILVESNGNDMAIRRNAAGTPTEYGCLQITKDCVDDVNRIVGIPNHFKWPEDALVRAKSIEMAQIYIGHYATKERLGREPDLQDMARIWNGGPDGWKQPETREYWRLTIKAIRGRGREGWKDMPLPDGAEAKIR